QLGVAVVVPLLHPVPTAFLDQPQAHDVLQEPERPADAPLVGVVVGEAFGVDHRLAQLDAHQRPGARADVAPVAGGGPFGGDRGHRAGGIVAAGGNHRYAPNIALLGHVAA